MSTTLDKYLTSDYLESNPTWDSEDSPWKASQVAQLLKDHSIDPNSVCEVGCGAGVCLVELRKQYSEALLSGFDIAPDAARFWEAHSESKITFEVGNFLELNQQQHDLILLLDVIEHLENPFEFLVKVKKHGKKFVFHIPLDLSAVSVMRETPLLHVREKVGHIHYYTRGLALALLEQSGYKVTSWRYTNAYATVPGRSWKTRIGNIPRHLVSLFSKDLSARLFGGQTLLVLAE